MDVLQRRDGLPPSLAEEKRYFELYGTGKADTPDGWNNPENWKYLEDIPEGRPFGFAIGNKSDYLLIDFDHVANGDKWIPWAHDVYKRLMQYGPVYTEKSVSGTGLHMVCDLGDFAEAFAPESNGYDSIIVDMPISEYRALSDEEKSKTPKVEFFYHTDGRYVYLTGNNVVVHEIAKDEQAAAIFRELKLIREEYHAKHHCEGKDGEVRFNIDEDTRKRVLAALPYISGDCSREEWVHVGIALHHCGFDFEAWDNWSRFKNMQTGEMSDKYKDGETERIWKSFEGNRSHWNAGTIIKMAKQFGFQITPGEFKPLDRFENDALQNLPKFPVDCLPEVLRGFAQDVSKCNEVPVDMVACEVLSVLGAACMGKFKIRLAPTWLNPLNIYLVCVGKPGDGKSASLKLAEEPFREWVEIENFRRESEIRDSAARIRFLEKEYAKMEQRIGSHSKDEKARPVTAEDLSRKQAEIDRAKKEAVLPITVMQDDVTPEALSVVMEANEERAVIITPEGGFCDVLEGRYNEGKANLDLVNKAFDGERYTRTRVSGGQIALKKPLATLGLFVQPKVLQSCMGNEEFRGRGFVSRFLYSYPKSMVGFRKMENLSPNESAREAYRACVMDIMNCSPNDLDCIKLSPEAESIFKNFRLEIEGRLKPGGDLETVSDMATRVAGNTGRIMGILHVVENLNASTLYDVTGAEAERAVTIGRYFFEHLQGIVFGMGEPEEVTDAKYIFYRVRDTDNRDKCDKGRLSARDLLRICRRFKTVDSMQRGLKELERRGYIRTEKKDGTRGEWIYFNPAAFE